MKIDIVTENNSVIARVISNEVVIIELQDALDLMANCNYLGATSLIINKECIIPDFFDLKTGIAGEILQKFSTYNFRLAIVGDFSNITSKSLRDFIYESNKLRRINFVGSEDEAKVALK